MSDDSNVTSIEERIKLKLAQKGKVIKEQTALDFNPVEDAPEIEFEVNPEQMLIDDAIKNLDVTDAYRRWCNKSAVPATKRREGIKVSCPNPAHPDKDPSAWLNRDKNTFYCGSCAEGGDIWDIAAYHFGFSVPGYKTDGSFRELREKIALDLGFQFVTIQSQVYVITAGSSVNKESDSSVGNSESPSSADTEGPSDSGTATEEFSTPTVTVGLLPTGAAAVSIEEDLPPELSIDWRRLLPPDTFLHEWLQATSIDDCPEEFHFWTGLMALGFAIGRNVQLEDSPQVVGNLFVCLVGPSGSGKSKAKRHLRNIVAEVLPYDDENALSTGTKLIGRAGSGEYLVSTFSSPIPDPANPKKTMGFAPVRGFVDYEEFAGLVAASNRPGSTLKDQLMDIYDAQKYLAGGSITNGRRHAQDPYGQAISTTQNGSLKRLLKDTDDVSGFINRWVFATGTMKPVRPWGGVPVDLTVPGRYLRNVYAWGSASKSLTLAPEALELWTKFFLKIVHPNKMRSEQAGSSMLQRIDLLLKKIILLLTANLRLDVVPVSIIQCAIDLYPYLIESYNIVRKEMKRTEETDVADLIIEQINRMTTANGVNPTGRDIYNAIKHKFESYKQCGDILKRLNDLEVITGIKQAGKVGRPTVRYAVNE